MTSDAIEDVKGASGTSPMALLQRSMLSNTDASSAGATDPLQLAQDLLQSFGDLLSAVEPLLSAIAPLLQGARSPGSTDGSPLGQSLGDALAQPCEQSPCGCGDDAGNTGDMGETPATPSGSTTQATPVSPTTPTAPTTPTTPTSSTTPTAPLAATPRAALTASTTPTAPTSSTAPADAFKWGSTTDPTPKQVADKYHNEIAAASKASGIDPKILAGMIWQESKGKADTPGGGLMQIGDGEFNSHGGGNISNPRDNIMAGAMYLKELSKPYGDNIEAGLRAYNSGPNGVDINNLASTPKGTGKADYIDKVLAAADESGL